MVGGVAALAEYYGIANRIRGRIDGTCRCGRSFVGVDADMTEISTEALLHHSPCVCIERRTWPSQRVMNDRWRFSSCPNTDHRDYGRPEPRETLRLGLHVVRARVIFLQRLPESLVPGLLALAVDGGGQLTLGQRSSGPLPGATAWRRGGATDGTRDPCLRAARGRLTRPGQHALGDRILRGCLTRRRGPKDGRGRPLGGQLRSLSHRVFTPGNSRTCARCPLAAIEAACVMPAG